MVLPRTLLLLCVAAALALSDVGTASAEPARRQLAARRSLGLHEFKHSAKGVYFPVEPEAEGGKKHHHHHHHREADEPEKEEEEVVAHDNRIHVQIKKHSQGLEEADATDSETHPAKHHHHGRHHAKKQEETETTDATKKHHSKHHHHGRHHAKKEDAEEEVATTAETKKHHSKHHHAKKDVTETTGEDGEVVRTYDYGSVYISGNGASTTTSDQTTAESKKHHKRHSKHHDANKDAAETDGETVQTYEHGSVRTSDTGAAANSIKKHHKHHKHHAKKQEEAAADDQVDVKSTADQVTELATQLASTSTDESGQGFFTNTFAPVVMICGIIGSLALVVGVVALVTTRPNQEQVDVSSVLDADIDVEANVTAPEAKEDVPAERRDSLSDSDSDSDDEAEGTFANSASVSV
jgi:hypothetical protein